MNFDNGSVRRQDRLLCKEEAVALLNKGEFGFLSMVTADQSGYGIPISYAWDPQKKRIYFHCAPEGEKLDALKHHRKVTFCVVGDTDVISHQFTTAYESVLVKGTITTELSDEEKRHALELILEKYAPGDKETGLQYAAKSFHRTHILRMDIESLSGKCKKRNF